MQQDKIDMDINIYVFIYAYNFKYTQIEIDHSGVPGVLCRNELKLFQVLYRTLKDVSTPVSGDYEK